MRLGPQISRRLVNEGIKDVSHKHRPSLPPRMFFWYSFLLEDEPTPRSYIYFKIIIPIFRGFPPFPHSFLWQSPCPAVPSLLNLSVRSYHLNLNHFINFSMSLPSNASLSPYSFLISNGKCNFFLHTT
jgi:hypothetical protein